MFIKFIATIAVFAEIGFFGYLPYIWEHIGHNKRVMSIVNCFASGLFLSLAFLHILPEANE
jgi:zinc transporter ZupT